MAIQAAVIGSGPQGIQCFQALQSHGVDPSEIAMIDAYEAPAHVFRTRLEHCLQDAMPVPRLLSPARFNVDAADPSSFLKFHNEALNQTPRLDHFIQHVDYIFESFIQEHYFQAMPIRLLRSGERLVVETTRGTVDTKNVIFALGAGSLYRPDFVKAVGKSQRIHHILDVGFDRKRILPTDETVIVGAGINGLLAALSLSRCHPGKIKFLLREDLSWASESQAKFWWQSMRSLFDPMNPVKAIGQLRDSFTYANSFQKLIQAIRLAVSEQKIQLVSGSVLSAEKLENEDIRLVLEDGNGMTVQHLVLATGFAQDQLQSTLLRQCLHEFSLKVAEKSPVIDQSLRWQSEEQQESRGIYVMGSLAGSQLGFSATFLAGGIEAAHRIAKDVGNKR